MFAKDRSRRQVHWFPFTEQTEKRLATLIRLRHGKKHLAMRMVQRILPVLAGVILPGILTAQPQAKTHLSVEVQLTAHARGELGYLIFDSPSGFPSQAGKALIHGFVTIPANATRINVEADLSPGTYAVSVYEDLNGNHKLDRNFLGIPHEPVGVSNNPHVRIGPPRFSESSFQLGTLPKSISMVLVQPS